MSAPRIFYVTQDTLSVWQHVAGRPERVLSFRDSDDGLQEFDAYLAVHSQQDSLMLIDVIEEEFAADTIPKLGYRDRSTLLQRRLQRKFPRTRYKLPIYQGSRSRQSEDCVVIHSAVSNHELLDHWLGIIQRQRTPLSGVYSVPLMAAAMLKRLSDSKDAVLLLTQHQKNKLRQVFLRDGRVQSARLLQSPSIEDSTYPGFIVEEAVRSRRYLERGRLLSHEEPLTVCVVAEEALSRRISKSHDGSVPLTFDFVEPKVAADKLGIASDISHDNLEVLYLSQAAKRRPENSYAVSGESRYFQMRRLRQAVVAAALGVTAIASVMSGVYLSKAWQLNSQSAEIESQVQQLSETYRRENEKLEPLKAGSHEMKVAVDTGDYILTNRLPVPWVMLQVGTVMGAFPDVRIERLGWNAESPPDPNQANRRRGDRPVPVPIPAITSVSAEITASIERPDGDMRKVFQRIDEMVAALESRTAFSTVQAVEYPLDARPQASLAGEIVKDHRFGAARFRIQLTLPVQPGAATTEPGNEAI